MTLDDYELVPIYKVAGLAQLDVNSDSYSETQLLTIDQPFECYYDNREYKKPYGYMLKLKVEE